MVRFTTKTTTPTVPNKEGYPAHSMPVKTSLTKRVATSNRETSKFYGYDEKALVEEIHEVLKTDPEYILKLAAYTRNNLNLRSIPVLLLTEYANATPVRVKGSRKWVPVIVRRADEVPEVLACQFERNSRIPRKGKIPNMLKDGLARTFEKFSPYQLAKYRGDNRSVTLRDAMFMLHPKPLSAEMATVYDNLAEGTLRIEGGATWERIISEKGSNTESWTEAARVMPYMALLRNLRNLVQHDVPNLKHVCEVIANPENVAKSKQFPYRFLSAYRELEAAKAPSYVLAAVSDALDASVGNMPELPGRTAIWSDNSGSMHCRVSEKSVVTMIDIATIMAAALYRANPNSIVGVFGLTAQTVSLNPRDSVMTNARKLAKTNVGHATYAHYAITETLPETVDRFVIFSDMQTYGGNVSMYFNEYCRQVNPNCTMTTFDLQGYGTHPFKANDSRVTEFSGWSDRALKLIATSPEGLVKEIEATSLASYQ